MSVTAFDGFDPSAASITLDVEGAGFEVGQFPLIDYSATSPLANIDNFTLGTLPGGVVANLVNNTASQSIDLQITGAVRLLTWTGDFGLGAENAAEWDELQANWTLPDSSVGSYNNSYPAPIGFGDDVVFDGSAAFDGFSNEVVLTTPTLTPASVTVSNPNTGFAATYTFTGSGKLSGSMSLTKSNTGNLIIENTGGNDYTGGTFAQNGTLTFGIADALPPAEVFTIGAPNLGVNVLMNGFDQTLAGIVSGGSGGGTRLFYNGSATATTLTLDVPVHRTTSTSTPWDVLPMRMPTTFPS